MKTEYFEIYKTSHNQGWTIDNCPILWLWNAHNHVNQRIFIEEEKSHSGDNN